MKKRGVTPWPFGRRKKSLFPNPQQQQQQQQEVKRRPLLDLPATAAGKKWTSDFDASNKLTCYWGHKLELMHWLFTKGQNTNLHHVGGNDHWHLCPSSPLLQNCVFSVEAVLGEWMWSEVTFPHKSAVQPPENKEKIEFYRQHRRILQRRLVYQA